MLDRLTLGSVLLADRAYDADKLRAAIADKALSPMFHFCPSAFGDRRSSHSSIDAAT